ncbi:MAG: hypothetical protein Q7K40_00795 [bacterium]|nr:hypothetical protein [bacterium]
MENIQVYIGYAAGILGFIPFILLIISMRKGITKPNLAGWVLYTVAMVMIVASSIALNAWQAVWLAMAYVVGQSLVIAVSFKTGYFSFSRFDYWCLSISFLSLILWIYTNNPLYALVLNVIVDGLGTFAISRKLYLHPGTEDTTAWVVGFLVALLNVFAVASFDISNALYPIYIVLACALIAGLSLRRVNAINT